MVNNGTLDIITGAQTISHRPLNCGIILDASAAKTSTSIKSASSK